MVAGTVTWWSELLEHYPLEVEMLLGLLFVWIVTRTDPPESLWGYFQCFGILGSLGGQLSHNMWNGSPEVLRTFLQYSHTNPDMWDTYIWNIGGVCVCASIYIYIYVYEYVYVCCTHFIVEVGRRATEPFLEIGSKWTRILLNDFSFGRSKYYFRARGWVNAFFWPPPSATQWNFFGSSGWQTFWPAMPPLP